MTRAKLAGAAEKLKNRYWYARNVLRRNPQSLTKEEQKEVCFLVKKIEDHGFGFFPDHYIEPEILRLERLAGREN